MICECNKEGSSEENLERTAEFLKILSEKNRLKIICLLQKKEMCVCDIWQYFDLPQNLVSHHLKILREFGLVDFKKEGTKVIYSLNSQEIDRYYSLLSHYLSNRD